MLSIVSAHLKTINIYTNLNLIENTLPVTYGEHLYIFKESLFSIVPTYFETDYNYYGWEPLKETLKMFRDNIVTELKANINYVSFFDPKVREIKLNILTET